MQIALERFFTVAEMQTVSLAQLRSELQQTCMDGSPDPLTNLLGGESTCLLYLSEVGRRSILLTA